MSLALLFVFVVFASYRVWRFFALDTLPPLVAVRDRVDAAVMRRHGQAWAAGIACVWCSGWWVSTAAVVIVWHYRPLPLPGLWCLAVSAAVGLLGQLED